MSDRPNVVMICVDQWRGDCLGVEGHPVVCTPYLDHLASRGARFSRAYAACPTCVPARASLYTGLSQHTHGRVGYQDGVPWNYPVTIASAFADHDYHTQAVGKLHVYPERSLMGFHNVVLHDGYLHMARKRDHDLGTRDDYLTWLREKQGPDADHFDHGMSCNAYTARPWDKPESQHPTNWVTSQSIDFLRRRDPRRPFFLFMSYHRPHPPLDPPAWAMQQYLDADMPPVPVGDWAELFEPYRNDHDPHQAPKRLPDDALRRARAGYYGHMTHIDHQVHRFLEVLGEYGERENTWVCFVSDHGDLMGDHHLYAKSLPYEGSARVPLLLTGPEGCGIAPGHVDDHPIELRDVMPTLLDCAGLAVPESVEGRSALPLARGEACDWRGWLHGEHVGHFGSSHYITDGKHKYVWFSQTGHEQLFDLVNDPQELTDLAGADAAAGLLGQLRGHLIEALKDREEGFTDGKQLITGRPVSAVLSHVNQDC